VSDYLSNLKGEKITCCRKNRTVSKTCDIGISEAAIEQTFLSYGIKTKELEIQDLISEFENIWKLLEGNDAPIMIIEENSRVLHLMLIIGYGYFEDRKYVLISDPDNKNGQYYIDFECFKKIRITKAWECQIIERKDKLYLSEDIDTYKNVANLKNIIGQISNTDFGKRIKLNYKNQIHMLDPKYNSKMKSELDDKSLENWMTYFETTLFKDKNSCGLTISKSAFNAYPIIDKLITFHNNIKTN
jgi:hypothetical protein